jgi:hypothetical protein
MAGSGGLQSLVGVVNDGVNENIDWNIPSDGDFNIWFRDRGGENQIRVNTGPTSVTDGEWHHVAIAYDLSEGGHIAVYLDGSEVGKENLPNGMGDFGAWDYPVTLLARNFRGANDQVFDGIVDDLRLYNYLKTAESVAQLYSSAQNTCPYGDSIFDLSGPEGKPDCVVDLYDFEIFLSEWLTTGLYPS